MHLLIPFAAPLPEAGRAAARMLALPHLKELLGRWREVARDGGAEGDELSLSPPHERALAQALGLHGEAGLIPWAARAARADGVDVGDLAWGQLTPVHWHLGTEQVSLIDPAALMLDAMASRTLFDAVRELFTSEGFAMHWGAPLRWYAAHESLAGLACASLDRVIGRNVDGWLQGSGTATRLVRRLQNEVQMLLYTHPLNDARSARGLLPVNSFWISGCGVSQAESRASPRVDERLRAPTLAEDWAAWAKAWQTLDEGPLRELLAEAEAGRPAALTLCGERGWARYEPAPRGLLQRIKGLWSAPEPAAVLEAL